MKRKYICLLLAILMVLFFSLPTYAVEYEEASLMGIVFKLIFYLLIFVLVIIMTIYGTRLISKSFKGIASNKYLSLLDAINLPGGSKIVVVKASKKIYLLGINNSTITMIDSYDEGEFTLEVENFDNYLNRYLNRSSNYKNPIENLIERLNKKKDRDENDEENKF